MRDCTLLTIATITLIVLAAGSGPADADLTFRLTTDRPGRAFYTGETVSLNVHAAVPEQTVGYEVKDYDGTVVRTGEVSLAADRPEVLTFAGLGTGIYYIHFTLAEGGYDDAFCVIPRPNDDAGDAGVWGFQLQHEGETHYRLLAQMGVRFIRRDCNWPDHEGVRDQYNTGKMDRFASYSAATGLQLIPTMGYTPSFAGLKPDDYEPNRRHVFYPDAIEHWANYVKLQASRLSPQTVRWPGDVVVSGGTRETLPLVRSWEMWNEVDQNYYYGSWYRYVDLLRVASEIIKGESHHNRIMYGGSCGHWAEMGRTVSMGGLPYFDEISWHSNRNMEVELPKYYYGSPQLTYRANLPRPTIQTECYPDCSAGVREADYLVRLYATLKAWREEGYCHTSIGRLAGPADPESACFTYVNAAGEIVPNAKYASYAVARHLLAVAAHIGQLNLAEGVVAHLFARRGVPLLIMWADTPTPVTVNLGAGAARQDSMGRRYPLNGPSAAFTVTATPTIILGAAESYIPQAFQNQFERLMTTEYGFPFTTDSGYVRNMQDDINWENPGQSARLRATLQTAINRMGARPRRDAWLLDSLAMDVRKAMLNLAAAAVRKNQPASRAPNAIWRLQRMAEWLADATDALEPSRLSIGKGSASPARVSVGLEARHATVYNDSTGNVSPFCETLVDRGFRLAQTYARTKGQGAFIAAETAGLVAEAYRPVERVVCTGVLIVAHFPTARHMLKALLLHPGREHTIQFQVYNFTDQEVSGVARCTLADNWSTPEISTQFTVPAHSWTDRLPCTFSIPGEPEPWVLKWAQRTATQYCVSIPAQLSTAKWLVTSGTLSDGRQIAPANIEVNIGVWMPGQTP